MVKKLFLLLVAAMLLMGSAAQAEFLDALEDLGVYDTESVVLPTSKPTDKPLVADQAPSSNGQVIDDAGALTADKIYQITQEIEAIERKHQVDVVVLVTYDVPDDYSDSLWRVEQFADDFYDHGGYGMGDDFSGVLYLIDLNNRVQYISTGGIMMQYISDYREERIFDAAETYLYRSDWGGAALAAVRQIARYMEEGREKGVFLYDRDTGERLSGYHNPLEMYEILIALGGGVIAALIMSGSVGASYNLKGSTYSYDVDGKASCSLTKNEEHYLRESVSRVARSSGSSGVSGGGGSRSGGSGVHRSSSGRSHGGGGRRF